MHKKKTLLNVIDITIILLIVAIIAGSLVKNAQGKKNTEIHDTDTIVYRLTVENSDIMLDQLLKNGETLYLSEYDLPCGKLNAAPIKSNSLTYIKEESIIDNTPVQIMQPKFNQLQYDFQLEVSAQAQYNEEKGFLICDNEYIAPGKKLKIYTKNAAFECTVTSVESN